MSKRVSRVSLLLVFVLVITLVLNPMPVSADGPSTPTWIQQLILAMVGRNNSIPHRVERVLSGHGNAISFDLGVEPGQIGIAFGYGLFWYDQNGNLLSDGALELNEVGATTGGGCAMVVLQPGWYPWFTLLDGEVDVYQIPPVNMDYWPRKLVQDRFDEQGLHYGCDRNLDDIAVWNEQGASVPFSSLYPATTVAVRPTVVSQAAVTPVIEATQAATVAAATASPSADRRPSGSDQSISFSTGEAVYGWRIELSNGAVCDGGNCFLVSAPTNGTVTSGVVNPWPDEVSSAARANPWNGTANRS